MKVIIVGATGLVGSTILAILEERNFPISHLKLLASERSLGKSLPFKGQEIKLEVLDEAAFEGYDLAFFAAGGSISKKYVPIAIEKGVKVIDNSSYYRMDSQVPLVVPEVNPQDIMAETMLVANPNCSTIQCMPALSQIQKHYGLKRVIYSSYQSVSGSGSQAIDDLDQGTQNFYPYQIKGNLLPHIDDFLENAYTKEEMKMIHESRKILHQDDLGLTATTVRVPVRFSHAISVNVETEKPFQIEEVKALFNEEYGMKLIQNDQKLEYPMPLDAAGQDLIYMGRVRRDESIENGMNLWIVADNIRKGAALNSVQIAEIIIKKVKS